MASEVDPKDVQLALTAFGSQLSEKLSSMELSVTKAIAENREDLFGRLASLDSKIDGNTRITEGHTAQISEARIDIAAIKNSVADVNQIRKVANRLVMGLVALAFLIISSFIVNHVLTGAREDASAAERKTMQNSQDTSAARFERAFPQTKKQ